MTQDHTNFGSWHANVPKSIKRPAVIGLVVLSFAFFGFGIWAGTAPINSAVVASGKFIATGQNKIIQHLEGGIIQKIRVREGELVQPGQILFELDGTSAKAQLRRLVLKRYRLLAMQARLTAERNFHDEITFPQNLQDAAGVPEVQLILERQESEFSARRDVLESQIMVLQQEKAGITEVVAGLHKSRRAIKKQMELIDEELVGHKSLYEKGLLQLSRFLQYKRAKADYQGKLGTEIASIGRANADSAKIMSQIVALKSTRVEKSVEQLRTVETELDDLEEQLKSAQDILTRLEIRAPVPGIIVKLWHHTSGGVIAPGQKILEILPIEEDLLVEAYVQPSDIDVVREGNNAQLRLVALKQRVTPMVPGRVIYVSADTIEGRNPGEVVYLARIRMDEKKATEIEGFKGAPGMPVEVYIETGERTFIQYLVSPISDSFSRSFREQ